MLQWTLFKEESSTGKYYIKLPDGRLMILVDLEDYQRLLKGESLKKGAPSNPKNYKSAVSKPKVGKWFLIDRKVISENMAEIRRQCKEAVHVYGELYLEEFEKANKMADKNPDKYPRFIETLILPGAYSYAHIFECATEAQRKNKCEKVCDNVICNLELEMRICNGELAIDLFTKPDTLPYQRVTEEGWVFGGSKWKHCEPACLTPFVNKNEKYALYIFRRKLSQN